MKRRICPCLPMSLAILLISRSVASFPASDSPRRYAATVVRGRSGAVGLKLRWKIARTVRFQRMSLRILELSYGKRSRGDTAAGNGGTVRDSRRWIFRRTETDLARIRDLLTASPSRPDHLTASPTATQRSRRWFIRQALEKNRDGGYTGTLRVSLPRRAVRRIGTVTSCAGYSVNELFRSMIRRTGRSSVHAVAVDSTGARGRTEE